MDVSHVYLLTERDIRFSHNSRVEWWIGHAFRKFKRQSGAVQSFVFNENEDSSHANVIDWERVWIIDVKTVTRPLIDDTFYFTFASKALFLSHTYRISFVIDLSNSIFNVNRDSSCQIASILNILEHILLKLAPSKKCPVILPRSGYKLESIDIYVSILTVLPNSSCHKIVNGWNLTKREVVSQIDRVASHIRSLEKHLLVNDRMAHTNATEFTSLLRHGALSVSMMSPSYAPASIVILSDGCFSSTSMEDLDRSLAHLRAEAISCNFIILDQMFSSTPTAEMTVFELAVCAGHHVKHLDLCRFISHATGGFCVSGGTPQWHEMMRPDSPSCWNRIREAFLTLPLLERSLSLSDEGDLGWVPVQEIVPYSKVIRAPLCSLLAARLRDGYRLLNASVLSAGLAGEPPYLLVELALAWKPGVLFYYSLAGEWSLPVGENLPRSDPTPWLPLPAASCRVKIRIVANYTFLHEVTCSKKPLVTNSYRLSVIDRYLFHFRLLNQVDQNLVRLSAFNVDSAVYTVPEAFRGGLRSVFLAVPAADARLVPVPSSHFAEVGELSATERRFIAYWEVLLHLDPSQSFRLMHTHTIYLVLEHDSPLPPHLFLPPEGKRFTSSISCRQALERVHNMLSLWCSFVLLENHTYVRFGGGATPEYFCFVRLELRLPEVRVRVAFLAGTSSILRDATKQSLAHDLASLKLPPRGRQTVPKSRHKSAAPCSLDVDGGEEIGKNGAAAATGHPGEFTVGSPDEMQTSLTVPSQPMLPPLQRSWGETPCCWLFATRLDRCVMDLGKWAKQRFKAAPAKGTILLAPSRSNFEARGVSMQLLSQHLRGSLRVLIVQPPSLSRMTLNLMISTLVNLRFQEGFHLVRVGPQPGFICMAREVMLHKTVSQPCLVQYMIYPLWPATKFDNKAEVTRLINCFIKREALEPSHGHGIQIVTEMWIEPKHGSVVDPPPEASYWQGCSFSTLPEAIFSLDYRCLSAYVTCERLRILLTSDSASSMRHSLDPYSTEPLQSNAMLGSVQDLATEKEEIFLVRPNLPDLLELCPRFICWFALMQPEDTEAFVDRLCQLLIERLTFCQEVSLPEHTQKAIQKKLLATVEYPMKWRCLASHQLPGSSNSPDSSAIIHLFFIPRYSDATVFESRFPVFITSVSRTYLSFLLDDPWTYKKPKDVVLSFVSPFSESFCKEAFDLLERGINAKEVPESFVGIARQNSRFVPELVTMWSQAIRSVNKTINAYCNAFAMMLFNRLLFDDLANLGIREVLQSDLFRSLPVLSLPVTDFFLSACACTLAAIKKARLGSELADLNDSMFSQYDGMTLVLSRTPFNLCQNCLPSFRARAQERLAAVLERHFRRLDAFPEYAVFKPASGIVEEKRPFFIQLRFSLYHGDEEICSNVPLSEFPPCVATLPFNRQEVDLAQVNIVLEVMPLVMRADFVTDEQSSEAMELIDEAQDLPDDAASDADEDNEDTDTEIECDLMQSDVPKRSDSLQHLVPSPEEMAVSARRRALSHPPFHSAHGLEGIYDPHTPEHFYTTELYDFLDNGHLCMSDQSSQNGMSSWQKLVLLKCCKEIFWICQDEIVNSLHGILPVLDSTIEFVLTHFEDTRAALSAFCKRAKVCPNIQRYHSSRANESSAVLLHDSLFSIASGLVWASISSNFVVPGAEAVEKFIYYLEYGDFTVGLGEAVSFGDTYCFKVAGQMHLAPRASGMTRCLSETKLMDSLDPVRYPIRRTSERTRHRTAHPTSLTEQEVKDAFDFGGDFGIDTPEDADSPSNDTPSKSPLFWLMVRVGTLCISVSLHHLVSSCNCGLISKNDCMAFALFERAYADMRAIIHRVNQELLLDSLSQERICSALLVPDCVEEPTSRRSVAHERTKRTSRSDKPRFDVESTDEDDATHASSKSTSKRKFQSADTASNFKNSLGSASVDSSSDQPHYFPGCFACPEQLVVYMPIHPRILMHPGMAVDPGRRVIRALRHSMDTLAVQYRPNMFVLVDGSVANTNVQDARNNEWTPASSSISGPEASRRMSRVLCSRTGRPRPLGNSSAIYYVTLEEVLDPVSGKESLGLHLFGLQQPSPAMEISFRSLFSGKLDALTLEYFCDNLSRSSVTKISPDDLKFLGLQGPPKRNVSFGVPMFVLRSADWSIANSEIKEPRPASLLLSYAYYFRQHLLHVVSPMKLDKTASACRIYSPPSAKLFLYNRSFGEGVAKRGIAALGVQFRQTYSDALCVETHEVPLQYEETLVWPSLEDLQSALCTNPMQQDSLAVTIDIWECGNVDLAHLIDKMRFCMEAGLVDLITEYFVVPAPVALTEHQLNSYLVDVAIPWVKHVSARLHDHSVYSHRVYKLAPSLRSHATLQDLTKKVQSIVSCDIDQNNPNAMASTMTFLHDEANNVWLRSSDEACTPLGPGHFPHFLIVIESKIDEKVLGKPLRFQPASLILGKSDLPVFCQIDPSGLAKCLCTNEDPDQPAEVTIPRQKLGFLEFYRDTLTTCTYNWPKDENAELKKHCDSLVTWHADRANLFSVICSQKLGLFHSLAPVLGRPMVKSGSGASNTINLSRTKNLARSHCPVDWWQAAKSSARSIGTNSAAGGVAASSSSLPDRRRHATTTDDRSQQKLHSGSLNDIPLHDFLRIFQNCNLVPILERHGVDQPCCDLIHSHCLQALVAYEKDKETAARIERIANTLNSWHEAKAPPYRHSTEGLVDTKRTASDTFVEVLQFSRVLHTICTPILFCPMARKLMVSLAEQETEQLLDRTSSLPSSPSARSKSHSHMELGSSSSLDSPRHRLARSLKHTSSLQFRETAYTPLDLSNFASSQPSYFGNMATLFFTEYLDYLRKQVKFHLVHHHQCKNGSHSALFQRSIHLDGIHLMQVFMRGPFLCVWLRAVETHRFAWFASQAAFTGPLTGSVCCQVAAASVQHQHHHRGVNTSSGSFTRQNTKWEESSRLCDYTHLNSYAYDFHLRSVEAFFAASQSRYRQGVPNHHGPREGNTSTRQRLNIPNLIRRPARASSDESPHWLTQAAVSSIGRHSMQRAAPLLPCISESGGDAFNVVQFLDDLLCIHANMPAYAQCLVFEKQIRFPVDDFEFTTSQVFNYLAQSNVFPEFFVCHVPDTVDSPRHSNVLVEQSLQPFNSSGVSARPKTSQAGQSGPQQQQSQQQQQQQQQQQPRNAALRQRKNALADQFTAFSDRIQRLALISHYSTTFVLRMDSAEHLSICIILTDSRNVYPKSRLASLPFSSKLEVPREWPAVKPCFDFDSEIPEQFRLCFEFLSRTHHSAPIGAPGRAHTTLVERSSSITMRPRHTSFSAGPLPSFSAQQEEDAQTSSFWTTRSSSGSKEFFFEELDATELPISNLFSINYPKALPLTALKSGGTTNPYDLRWYISYLGTWPAHQFDLVTAMSQAIDLYSKRAEDIFRLAVLDCCKNRLWYKLFDKTCFDRHPDPTLPAPALRPVTSSNSLHSQRVALVLRSLLPHPQLSECDFQNLVNSAHCKLQLFEKDDRIRKVLQLGSKYLLDLAFHFQRKYYSGESAWNIMCFLFTTENSIDQESDSDSEISSRGAMAQDCSSTSSSADSVEQALVVQTWEPDQIPKRLRHLVFLNANYDEGLILLSWTEQKCSIWDSAEECHDFQLRAIFRSNLETRPTQSSQRVQIDNLHMFYEGSPLPSVVASIVEVLVSRLARQSMNCTESGARMLSLFLINSGDDDFNHERQRLQANVFPRIRDYCRSKYGLDLVTIDPSLGLSPQQRISHQANFFEHQASLYKKFFQSGMDCLPVILLGQKMGLPLLPRRISGPIFERMTQLLRRFHKRKHIQPVFGTLDSVEQMYHVNPLLEHVEYCLVEDDKLETICQGSQLEAISCLIFYGLDLCLEHEPQLTKEIEQLLHFDFLSGVSNLHNMTKSSLFSSDSGQASLTLSEGDFEDDAAMIESGAEICSSTRSPSSVSITLDPTPWNSPKRKCSPGSFKPIVIERTIVDLHLNHTDDSAASFIDMVPGTNVVDEKRSKKLDSIREKLISRVNLEQDSNYSRFEVLWRRNGGIDPEFHDAYLNSMEQAVYQMCCQHLDQHMRHKHLNLKNPMALAVQDAVSNSWRFINNFHLPLDESLLAQHDLEDSLKSICFYLNDTSAGSDAPMLILSDAGTGVLPSVAHWFTATAVAFVSASIAFTLKSAKMKENITSIGTNEGVITVTRALKEPVSLPVLLASVMLEAGMTDEVDIPDFSSFVEQLTRRCIQLNLIIIGAEHIRPDSNEVGEGIEPALPWLLHTSQLPLHLPTSCKLVLSFGVPPGIGKDYLGMYLCLHVPAIHSGKLFDSLLHFLQTHGFDRALAATYLQSVEKRFRELSSSSHGLQYYKDCREFLPALLAASPEAANITQFGQLKDIEKVVGEQLVQLTLGVLSTVESLTFNELCDLLRMIQHKSGLTTTEQGVILLMLHLLSRHGFINCCYLYDGYDVIELTWSARALNMKENMMWLQSLVDYFSGTGLNCDVKVAKQPLFFPDCSLFNLRKLRLLPGCLFKSGNYVEACQSILFNYNWLHAKLSSLGLSAVLADFDHFVSLEPTGAVDGAENFLVSQHCAHLVSQVLRRGGMRLFRRLPDALSTELTGQLLGMANFSGEANWLTYLIKQCDVAAPWHNVLMAVSPFAVSPVNPLLGTVSCHKGDLLSVCQQAPHNLLIKLRNDPTLYGFDFETGQMLPHCRMGFGSLHTAALGGEFGVLVDSRASDTLQVHRLTGKTGLVGLINCSQWLDPSSVYENQEGSGFANLNSPGTKSSILAVSVDTRFVGVLVESNMTPYNGAKNESRGMPNFAGYLSAAPNRHVLICDLSSGKPYHVLTLSPSTVILRLFEYAEKSESKHGFFCANSGEQLLGFNTVTGEQLMAVGLLASPRDILANAALDHLFLLCDEAQKAVVLHVDENGRISNSYKIVFKRLLRTQDSIQLLKVAKNSPLLAAMAERTVLIYDYQTDMVISQVNQPPGLPNEFKLPNSPLQRLAFQDVCFAMDDRVLVASIFRNILIWDIASSSPLAVMHAPIRLITQLHAAADGKHIVSYSRQGQQLNLWSLPVAISNSTLFRMMGIRGPQPRFERLTRPICRVHAFAQNGIMAHCQASDEVGLFDTRSGALVDLFTHDGPVVQTHFSANSEFLLVSTAHARPSRQPRTVVWRLATRKIVLEVNWLPKYCVDLYDCHESGIFVIHENDLIKLNGSSSSVDVVKRAVYGGNATACISTPFFDAETTVLFVLCLNERNGLNEICMTNIEREDIVRRITVDEFQQSADPAAKNIVQLRPTDSGRRFIAQLSQSKLISDVDALQTVVLCEASGEFACLRVMSNLPGGPISSLQCSSDLTWAYNTFTNQLFRATTRQCNHQLISLADELEEITGDLQFNGFALGNEMLIVSSGEFTIYAIRLRLLNVAGSVTLTEPKTCVSVERDRLINVGCADGSVYSFMIIDPCLDGSSVAEVNNLIQRIPSRCCSSTPTQTEPTQLPNQWPVDRERSWEQDVNSMSDLERPSDQSPKTEFRSMPSDTNWRGSAVLRPLIKEQAKTCSLM